MANFEELIGKTIEKVTVGADRDFVRFECSDGKVYKMHHAYECCETVLIDSITGEGNIIDSPVLVALEKTSVGSSPEGSATWTFYTIATVKGYCDIRWFGESNGNYSEEVSFDEVSP